MCLIFMSNAGFIFAPVLSVGFYTIGYMYAILGKLYKKWETQLNKTQPIIRITNVMGFSPKWMFITWKIISFRKIWSIKKIFFGKFAWQKYHWTYFFHFIRMQVAIEIPKCTKENSHCHYVSSL